jgi:hypothetical protein
MRGAVGDIEPGSFHGEDFKADEFRTHLQEVSPYKIEMQVIGAAAMHEILFDVLDEEQREMFNDMRGGMGGHFGARHGGGRAGS